MRLSIAGAPVGFELHPALQYGHVPDLDNADPRLRLDLLRPDVAGPAPAVIYFHGGGWQAGDRAAGLYPWVNPLLAAHGFVTLSVTYRLTDVSAFPAQIHDAKAAVRWLRANAGEYGVDPDRIGVWGDSAGGHIAALLGTSDGVPELEGAVGSPGVSAAVQAVVARCPPTDFDSQAGTRLPDGELDDQVLRKLFAVDPAERDEWMRLASPITHVRAGVPPFLLVHGTEDELVPYEQSPAMLAALQAVGGDATLHTVAGGHHNMLADIDAPWNDDPWEALGQEALDFFRDRLGPVG